MINKDEVDKIVNDVSHYLHIATPKTEWYTTFPKKILSQLEKVPSNPNNIPGFINPDDPSTLYLRENELQRHPLSLLALIIHELVHIQNSEESKRKGEKVDAHGREFQRLEDKALKAFDLIGQGRDSEGYLLKLKTKDGKVIFDNAKKFGVDLTDPDTIKFYKDYFKSL